MGHILLTYGILYRLDVRNVRSYKVKYAAIEMYVFTMANGYFSVRFARLYIAHRFFSG